MFVKKINRIVGDMKKSINIAVTKFSSSKGSSAAHSRYGLFLCPDMIPAVQPRNIVVMAMLNPYLRILSAGSGLPFFYAHKTKITSI